MCLAELMLLVDLAQCLQQDVAVMKNGSYIRFVIPKALPISQLSGATFPLDIPVRVVEQQDTAGRGGC